MPSLGLKLGLSSKSPTRSSAPETWDVQVLIGDGAFNFSLVIYGSKNLIVDWGDGTIQTITDLTLGSPVYTKTYSTAGLYTIKIKGSMEYGTIRFGNNTTQRSRVVATSAAPKIIGLISFNGTFDGCGIQSVPEDLFAYNPDITDVNGCFIKSGLKSIPPNLFSKNTKITDFSYCFSQCRGLSSIPFGLFANNTAATNFDVCFFNCDYLTALPSDLFINNINAELFNYTFQNCIRLTSVPSNLFVNNIKARAFINCFFNVTLTTTSYSELLANIASNASLRPNNVPFGGGKSKYNNNGAIARSTLTAKNWSISDGGLQS